MKSLLRERLERLGPVRDVDRVPHGSPDVLTFKPEPDARNILTVRAALALARRGLSLLQAKRVMEKLLDEGEVTVRVPRVESRTDLARELALTGIVTLAVGAPEIDVKALRESLKLTQEQFALRYGLELDALRNWEHGRRQPDKAARNYLRAIQRMPDAMKSALEEPVDASNAT